MLTLQEMQEMQEIARAAYAKHQWPCLGQNRDGSRCRHRPAQLHHRWWKSKKGRFTKNNLEPTCKRCHDFFHRNGGRNGESLPDFFRRFRTQTQKWRKAKRRRRRQRR